MLRETAIQLLQAAPPRPPRSLGLLRRAVPRGGCGSAGHTCRIATRAQRPAPPLPLPLTQQLHNKRDLGDPSFVRLTSLSLVTQRTKSARTHARLRVPRP